MCGPLATLIVHLRGWGLAPHFTEKDSWTSHPASEQRPETESQTVCGLSLTQCPASERGQRSLHTGAGMASEEVGGGGAEERRGEEGRVEEGGEKRDELGEPFLSFHSSASSPVLRSLEVGLHSCSLPPPPSRRPWGAVRGSHHPHFTAGLE